MRSDHEDGKKEKDTRIRVSYLVDNLQRIVPSVGTWISVTDDEHVQANK